MPLKGDGRIRVIWFWNNGNRDMGISGGNVPCAHLYCESAARQPWPGMCRHALGQKYADISQKAQIKGFHKAGQR